MSAEWTFCIFVIVGTLAFILAPEVWQQAFVESRVGRTVDRVFAALASAFGSFWDFILPPMQRAVRWLSRG